MRAWAPAFVSLSVRVRPAIVLSSWYFVIPPPTPA
jgi:hypothetical protein